MANSSHKKKKKFDPCPKLASVTVVMLEKYQTRIPRGEYRQRMMENDRVQKVELHRRMTSNEAKREILRVFKCKDFIVLDCAKGGYLLKAKDKPFTSQMAIDRRGALYLCEKSLDVNCSNLKFVIIYSQV